MANIAGAGFGDSPGERPKPAGRALIIGIDRYAQPHVPDLRGCVADAHAVYRLLTTRFRIPKEHVTLLTNEAATRQGIFDAFEQLIEATQPNEPVFVHYSGHGSQMPDLHGDEPDGKDETIVPHDSRDPEGRIFDISDDELFAFVERLRRKTNQIVLIFDCCHSGSITRDLGTVRRIPPDERQPPTAVATRGLPTHREGMRGALPLGDGYVLVSGARAEELSNEYEVFLDGERATFGALTYHLVQTLTTLRRDMTWREVIADVSQQVSALFPTQHPIVEGEIERLVFNRRVQPREAAFQVTAVQGDLLTIDAGQAHGVRPRMTMAIYAPDVATFEDLSPLATARVLAVQSSTATARLDERREIPVGARVRLLTPTAEMRLPLVLDESAVSLRPRLAQNPWIRLVEGGEAPSSLFIRVEDGQIHLETLTGRPLVAPFSTFEVERLERIVRQIARYRQLLQLRNPDPASQLHQTTGLRLHRLGTNGEPAPFQPDADGLYRATYGEKLVLEVINRHTRPFFFTLLVFGSDFSVQPLYPPPGAVDNRLEAQKSFWLGLKGELRVAPPPGATTILLMVTEQPSDFRSLVMPGVRSLSGAPSHPLETLLQMSATRGLTLTSTIEDDWAVHRLTFLALPS